MSRAEQPEYLTVEKYLALEEETHYKSEYIDGCLGCTLAMRNIYDGVEFTDDCVQETEAEYECNQQI